MSHITTHILDTAAGKPAAGVPVILQQFINNDWQNLAKGITNKDGRIADLLSNEQILSMGEYKLIFETEAYFTAQKAASFYPTVEIRFYVRDASHYHVPLLLSPFGYTTYRGS